MTRLRFVGDERTSWLGFPGTRRCSHPRAPGTQVVSDWELCHGIDVENDSHSSLLYLASGWFRYPVLAPL